MRITAQEAKNLAYEACKQEIDQILALIKVAARNKKLEVFIPKTLEPVTVDYLITEGKFNVTGSNRSQYMNVSNGNVKYHWHIQWN